MSLRVRKQVSMWWGCCQKMPKKKLLGFFPAWEEVDLEWNGMYIDVGTWNVRCNVEMTSRVFGEVFLGLEEMVVILKLRQCTS